ncbi:MAG: stage III sporulation protein AC [Clostridia bacterium]|nr:stage III sporulation protein AC [Clostridia bacterium]
MELIFKVAGSGMIVAVLHVLLSKAGREEQALMVTIAGLVTVLLLLVGEVSTLFSTLQSVFGG